MNNSENGDIQFTDNKSDEKVFSEKPALSLGRTETSLDSSPINSGFYTFLYLVNFFCLWLVFTGVYLILSRYIVENFPTNDPVTFSGFLEPSKDLTMLNLHIASIIIAGPIFLAVSYFLTKYMYVGRISPNAKSRNYTTYATIFIASSIIIFQLVSLVFKMLENGLYTQIVLKLITILSLTVFSGGYYFWDLRKKQIQGVRFLGNRIFFLVTILILIGALSLAVFLRSYQPSNKNIIEDSQLLSNMKTLKTEIAIFYNEKGTVPKSLQELQATKPHSVYSAAAITYELVNERSYKICGDFKTASPKTTPNLPDYWWHQTGYQCFTNVIDTSKRNNQVIQPSAIQSGASGTTSAVAENGENMSIAQSEINQLRAIVDSSLALVKSCVEKNGGKGGAGTGKSGDSLCGMIDPSLKWPDIKSLCQQNDNIPSLYVGSYGPGGWSYMVSCSKIPECSGEANLVCRNEGCFSPSGTCQIK